MNNYTKINEILHFSDIHPVDCRFILSYISELEKENEKLKEENSRLKYLPKQIKQYILSEMYVDMDGMTVIAGWLEFDKLLKMIDRGMSNE